MLSDSVRVFWVVEAVIIGVLIKIQGVMVKAGAGLRCPSVFPAFGRNPVNQSEVAIQPGTNGQPDGDIVYGAKRASEDH
jgi:hypothetical protein